MSLPTWLDEQLTGALALSNWQQLGLAFLLGSFVVAAWSDLKYLAAQREFLEVWLVFLVVVLAHDAYLVQAGRLASGMALLKWGLLVGLSVLSLREVGVLFRLARGDVAALAAGGCLLPPLFVIVFFLAARVFDLLLRPALARGRRFYPFMPVVTLATVAVLALALALRAAGRP
jgi:prepilin signal peptidase PulO-like enzyme (type II secretory pathway)